MINCGALETFLKKFSDAGLTWYNLGQIALTLKRLDEALEAYKKAIENFKGYGRSGYYFRERGDIHFQLGRLEEAATDYRKAASLGDAPEAQFLLASTLMHQGLYEDASRVSLDAYIPNMPEFYANGCRVFQVVISRINDMLELSQQERSVADREAVNRVENPSATAEDVVEVARAFDGLHPSIWLRLAAILGAEGRLSEAFECSLVAAWVVSDNPKLWAWVIAAGIDAEATEELLEKVWLKAQHFAPTLPNEIESLAQDLPERPSQELRELMFRLGDRSIPFPPRVVRVLSDDEGTEEAGA
ncbi:hypothetical protein GCM10028833_39310 [Glycomyces tarimensis]